MDDHISVDLINYNYPYIELIQTQGTPDFDFYNLFEEYCESDLNSVYVTRWELWGRNWT